ncbi:MAG: CBS domain-containing protein [Myxococcota bacterium]
MRVRDILETKGSDVVTTTVESSLLALSRLLTAHRIGAAVVVDRRGSIVGIASERDLVIAVASRGPGALEGAVMDVMSSEVLICEPDDDVQTVMSIMTERRIRHMPVLDPEGRLAGVISIGDVVKVRVGEVEQEARMLRDYIEAR